jgi:hypothetical protein
MTKVRTRLIATGVAAATALSAMTPGWSAPVFSGSAAIKAVAPSAIDVQWRPAYGWAIAGAAAAGIIAGAAIARPRYYGYYGGYYAPPPAYGVPPAYATAPGAYYYGPPPPPSPQYYSYRNQQDPAGCGPGTHAC